jgi:hypothetical protein
MSSHYRDVVFARLPEHSSITGPRSVAAERHLAAGSGLAILFGDGLQQP